MDIPLAPGEFRVTIWGCRGSYPVCNKDVLHFGGNTTCTEVEVGGHRIIIDAGTGIINLGTKIMKEHFESGRTADTRRPIVLNMLFTHMHHDHNQGFPFFKPLYLGSTVLYVFGPKFFDKDMGDVLGNAMLPPFFPVELDELSAAKAIRNIMDTEVVLLGGDYRVPVVKNIWRDQIENDERLVKIRLLKSYAHPKNGVIIYRIEYKGKSFVFATDTEGYVRGDRKLIEFARGADVMVHDAQYTLDKYAGLPVPTQGWGHSTPEMAIMVAKEAGVRQLILTHHDPDASDDTVRQIEAAAAAIYPGTRAAFEGMTIDL